MPTIGFFRSPDFLYMLWPARQAAPTIPLAAGYRLRTFVESDATAYCALVNLDPWEDTGWRCRDYALHDLRTRIVPQGFFVVDGADGTLVATATARHRPDADSYDFPDGGELCLVYVHPDHRRAGLGKVVTTTAVRRLQAIGYRNIYLNVSDNRLPALRMYLTLGFLPLLYNERVAERWRQICTALAWPFADAHWPTTDWSTEAFFNEASEGDR